MTRIIWDEAKNTRNKKKHGVSFEIAQFVFDDPYVVSLPERVVDDEQRWQSIGMVYGAAILLVAHTVTEEGEDEETIRIISARRATAAERRRYEESL